MCEMFVWIINLVVGWFAIRQLKSDLKRLLKWMLKAANNVVSSWD
jgi:hypothetical protein